MVGRNQAEVSVESLRPWLGEKLPDYMIPSHFFILPALPLTPNGKVDRKALEKFEGDALASGTEYVAPRTELEGQLVVLDDVVAKLVDSLRHQIYRNHVGGLLENDLAGGEIDHHFLQTLLFQKRGYIRCATGAVHAFYF